LGTLGEAAPVRQPIPTRISPSPPNRTINNIITDAAINVIIYTTTDAITYVVSEGGINAD
jgi:hypothetical protein